MKKNTIQNIFRILFWSFFIFITVLAFIPQSIKVVPRYSDKFNHLVAFFILTMLGNFAFNKPLLKLSLYLLSFGFFIELVQFFLPYRRFSLIDLCADLIGIFVFVIIQFGTRKLQSSTSK
jgi:VanZ family protein